jgi:4-hydroxy-tetrahydrodipicolinate synthase
MISFRVEGSWPALVTPFTERDEVNLESLTRLVEFHVTNDSTGILLLGSTSEVTLLKSDEKWKIVDVALEAVEGRVPVMCGISASTTRETIENARRVKGAGVDCGLLVQPSYIRPTQEALYFYFKEVAEKSELPIVIYNNPERAGVNIQAETLARLAQIDNILALKEAGPNPYGLLRVIELTKGKFNVLCCDCPQYALVLPVLAGGGKGTSNVTGNIVPREFAEMSKPWETFQDVVKSRELYFRLFPLMRMMYSETNPVPLKAALNMLGGEVGLPRKPLMKLSKSNMELLKTTLNRLGILDEGSYQKEFFSKK